MPGGMELVNDTVLALMAFKEVINENERLKDEINIVIKTAL